MTLVRDLKRILVKSGAALSVVVAVLLVADFFNLLPSLPRALGTCKAEATTGLAGLRREDDQPSSDERNYEWHSKHAEIVQACMEAHGYKFDKRAAAVMVTGIMERNKYDTGAVGAVDDTAAQIERYWSRRWFWQ